MKLSKIADTIIVTKDNIANDKPAGILTDLFRELCLIGKLALESSISRNAAALVRISAGTSPITFMALTGRSAL
ncbi:MAG: hypothetical protein K8S15_02375 [Candidatus Aegiribacteria sp.]|nr:hypothetical protein [Candidatus Aegiribacteria sp.]